AAAELFHSSFGLDGGMPVSPRNLVLHDGGERFGVERRSAYQRAVDFFFRHQGMSVLWFDGAAVEDAEFAGEFLAERLGGFGSNDGVGVGGHLRGCGLSGADGPDRFIGDDQAGRFFGGDFVERAETLAAQDVVGESGFAFFENFAHADDGDESGFEGGLELEVYGVVGLAEVLAAFGMSDDDVGYPNCHQHAGADFAGIGAFGLPVDVLRADGYVRALSRMDGGVQRKVGWADDDFVAVVA